MTVQNVLTTASNVACPLQGKVATSSDAKLRVGETKDPVLLESSIKGKDVTGCTQTDSSTTKQCKKVVAVSDGASKLQVGGKPVMRDSLTGTTDGLPPALAPAVAGQTKLRAS
jgi:hypothetical protein